MKTMKNQPLKPPQAKPENAALVKRAAHLLFADDRRHNAQSGVTVNAYATRLLTIPTEGKATP
jgi:hypothetical protein